MNDFETTLYEALLVAFGKVLAKYNAFAQAAILRDVGKEIVDYLNRHGFDFQEKGDVTDLAALIDLFVKNGFAAKLEVEPAEKGTNYVWHKLYGRAAYKELHEISDNPFLACPLNLCLFYVAEKHGKTLRLHGKSFDADGDTVRSQYELVDAGPPKEGEVDPLVIENARLYQLAEERACRLEKAQSEIRTLTGILPICSYCKRIRDEQGNWQKLEVYVRDRTEADFTHSFCPECERRMIDGLNHP